MANLDADDVWLPEFLDELVKALQAAGPDSVFAFARSRWVDEHDQQLDLPDVPFPSKVDYRELLLHNPVGNSSASVFRTQVVRDVGGYDEGIVDRHGCTEDWLLMLRLSWRGIVVPVDRYLVHYRISANSASHALSGALGGMLEAVSRAEREGPPLPRPVYWRARSLAALWLLRRALKMRQWPMCARLIRLAYLSNPLWFVDRDLRRPVVARLRHLAPHGSEARLLPVARQSRGKAETSRPASSSARRASAGGPP